MSTQHPIDLLPDAIRARGQAGVRTGRYIASAVLCTIVLVVASTHARLGRQRAEADLIEATAQADLVLATEAKADELTREIEALRDYVGRYRKLAPPLAMGELLATVVNAMPPGMTLDRVDLDAGFRRAGRTARSRGPEAPAAIPPRVLNGEIAGFAPRDEDIAVFVSWLDDKAPFRDVSLDFSRTRAVNGRPAREFRLSFRVDLDAPYTVRRDGDHPTGEGSR